MTTTPTRRGITMIEALLAGTLSVMLMALAIRLTVTARSQSERRVAVDEALTGLTELSRRLRSDLQAAESVDVAPTQLTLGRGGDRITYAAGTDEVVRSVSGNAALTLAHPSGRSRFARDGRLVTWTLDPAGGRRSSTIPWQVAVATGIEEGSP